jgi:biotin transporter BioY
MELLLVFAAASVVLGFVADRIQRPVPTIVVLMLIAVVATGYLSRRFIL